MLPAQHWAYSFSIGADDIESITNLLLERETPLSSVELATEIIKAREDLKRQEFAQKYLDAKVYRPSERYEPGDRLTFSQLNYATARVVKLREGKSTDLRPLTIAAVEFEDSNGRPESRLAEYVIDYDQDHPLNDADANRHPSQLTGEYTVDDILNDDDTDIVEQVDDALERNADLVRLAGTWFVRELMLEVDIGHLHLAEAVLDMNEGGPLRPKRSWSKSAAWAARRCRCKCSR